MRRKVHPLSGAVYEDLGNGLVSVDKAGKKGIFKSTGEYVEGDLTFADLHMLVWVGGKPLPEGRNVNQRMMGVAGREVVHD
jgi:hypothetical protein